MNLSSTFAHALMKASSPGGSRLTLPQVGEQNIDSVTAKIQPYLDFLTGPVAVLLTCVFLAMAAVLWYQAPRDGWVASAMRGAAVGFVLLNLPLWVTYLVLK